MQILIIDEVHGILIEGLKQMGFKVDYCPEFSRTDLIRDIGKFDGLIVRTKTAIDENVLSHAGKLKFIGRAGAGVDNIDTAFCDQKGIRYFNSGEANADAVGEHAMGMLIGLLAKIVKSDAEVRRGIWDREGNRGMGMKGKTIGIIGYGNTGRAFASKLSGFGVKILAYDKYLRNYAEKGVKETGMNEIFDECDVLSLHIPLTSETNGMVNGAYIRKFRKNIFLLNLSRGKIVKLLDLVEELKEGKVLGAGLDVLENENLDSLQKGEQELFDYLRNSDRTVLTPHVGGWTKESFELISVVLLQKIKELSLQ